MRFWLVSYLIAMSYFPIVAGWPHSKAVNQYVALFDNILHRLRFPKFVGLLSEEFDDPMVRI